MLIHPATNYVAGKGCEIIESINNLELGNRPYMLEDYINSGGDPYNPRSGKSMQEVFAHLLIEISAKITMACAIAYENDLIPFTEYSSFDKLLSLRYQRAIKGYESKEVAIKNRLAHLSLKIFDSIISDDELSNKSIEEIIKYRKETRMAYDRFRKYLVKLNYQIESNVFDDKFEEELNKVILTEVLVEADKFKSECKTIWEKMFGGLLKNVTSAPIGSILLSLFSGMSWSDILTKGCGLIVLPPLLNAALEQRKLNRLNSLSYLMGFGKMIRFSE